MNELLKKLLDVDKSLVDEMCKARTEEEMEYFAKARRRLAKTISNVACIEASRQSMWQVK